MLTTAEYKTVQQAFRIYYRLTKPGIVYGNSLSVSAGLLLAFRGQLRLGLALATLAGIALIMAGGCVYNNYLDRGIDAHMTRTKKRALVTGTVRGWQALLFATILTFAGFTILAYFTNALTVALGIIAIVMYVIVYGAAKRWSPLGTIVGSVSGALPPAAGYTAVTGHFDSAAWLLFLTMTVWQMPHFYAIAIYRLKEYQAAGIPVLPAKRGIDRTKRSIIGYVTAYLLVAPLLALTGQAGYVYFVGVTAIGLAWLLKGLKTYRSTDDVAWSRGMFFFSLKVLLVWTLAIAVDSFL